MPIVGHNFVKPDESFNRLVAKISMTIAAKRYKYAIDYTSIRKASLSFRKEMPNDLSSHIVLETRIFMQNACLLQTTRRLTLVFEDDILSQFYYSLFFENYLNHTIFSSH